MIAVLRAVYEVFSNPNFDDAANGSARSYYQKCGNNMEVFWQKVKEEADKNILDE